MATCCTTGEGLRIGNTVQVIDRLANSSDPDTPITDASVDWFMDIESGPVSMPMTWDGSYVYGGVTGWYVGAISSAVTETLTPWQTYTVTIKASGGGLLGTYSNSVEEQALP